MSADASTAALVDYALADGIATVRIDDGKRNALSPAVFDALNAAIDRAARDRAAIVFTGREDVFSAGFDLKVMKRGGPAALGMLAQGYALPARVLNHPHPVVTACNGHVLAMGVFLMLASDYVIGRRGDFKVAANEVAIGLTMPRIAAAMLEHRLTPAAYQRAVTLSEYFDVDAALDAGFFDELADGDALESLAMAAARRFLELDASAHAASKQRIRKKLTRRLRWGRRLDVLDAVLLGLKGGPARRKR